MERRPTYVATYLFSLKETCIRTLTGDPNSLVKEASLQVMLQMIDQYQAAVLVKVLSP